MKTRGLLSLLGVWCTVVAVTARNSRTSGGGGDGGSGGKYKGTYIGKLSTLEHGVTGHVYALNNITVYIEGFSYDGEAPDAFFFAGNNTPRPTSRGFIIPNEKGNKEVLGPYRNSNIILTFPITKKGQRSLNDVKWISVWCRRFAIDFGHVLIPRDLKKPSRQVATGLSSTKPLLSSSTVTILDTNTIQLDDFNFDGTVQDAIFVMGSGDVNTPGIQVANERSANTPLPKYTQKTLKLTVPPDMKGKPIQYFGVWSPSKGMLASVTFDPDALVPPAISDLV